MITIYDNRIDISITDTEPAQRVNMLIKAIAAAMRWNAMSDSKYKNDDAQLLELARLIEELSTFE